MQLEDTDSYELVNYVLLRAVDRFYIDFNRYPGEYKDFIEMDIPLLKVYSFVTYSYTCVSLATAITARHWISAIILLMQVCLICTIRYDYS
jgi:hypothetical protein